jgi:DNA-binding transcriptional ArsR family regulator
VSGYEFRLDLEDLARVRFAVSPLWETTHAVRSLVDPRQRAYHLPWLDEIRPRLREIDVAPLVALSPMRGYTPDLIAPAPQHPRTTAQEQLDRVRQTPLTHVRSELQRALADRGGEPMPEEMVELARDPQRARSRLADALEECWQVLVAPYWPRILDLLSADIAHHSRLLAERGLEALFPALSPDLLWHGRTLKVGSVPRRTIRRDTRGQGILLQPSAFSWPFVIAISDVPYQPTVVYPARGVAELWQPTATAAEPALARLLGRTRAMLLASVREPASTTTLARRHELAPATVSQHLGALAGGRLVTATRVGREVLYATSPLGDALLAG